MPTKTNNSKLETKSKKNDIKSAGHKFAFHKIIGFLSIAFFTIWIVIGLVILLFIYANFRQGAFGRLFNTASKPVPSQTQVPTETNLPGVGLVNIECIQSSLSDEAIQKLVVDGNSSNLSNEENSSLAPCIIKPESNSNSGN